MEIQEQMTLEPNIAEMPSMMTSNESGTTHIDALIDDFEADEKEVEIQSRINSGDLIDKAGFRTLFFGGAEICRNFKPDYQSLKMLDDSNLAAVNAINTLHECIMDVPQLHWLLNPGGKWAQRGFALAIFFVPFSIALIKDIKGQPKTASQAGKTAIKEHIVVNLNDFKEVG